MSLEPAPKARKLSGTNMTTKAENKIIGDEMKENVRNAGNVPPKAALNYEFNALSEDGTELKFKKLSPNAITPLRGSKNAAGFDLFSAETKDIPANGHGLVKTDIAVMLPKGTYGRVAPRSGLAVKHFVDVGAGVVDYDYRGNLGVVLFNHLNKPFQVKQGDRIAQFVIEKICMPKLMEVQNLDETERGSSGYGSTGK